VPPHENKAVEDAMGEGLSIEVRADGARVTLALTGVLDVVTTSTLRACLESIDDGFRHVELDLTDLRLMDSSGIGCLAETKQRFEPQMRTLTLHNPTGHVAMAVEMGGLASVMAVTTAHGEEEKPALL
jgi:anti-anti-sigma factor